MRGSRGERSMSRTRAKSRGRRGGEAERFAYIPESLLQSAAGQTLPHAALKVLSILLVGRTKERNGTMCCSESYAAKFGINSRDTLNRSLAELQRRGIIVITRRVQRFKKHPTLYAVTWWPIAYRDGEPLSKPEDPTLDYIKWENITPIVGVEPSEATEIRSHRPSGDLTPIAGVESAIHHTDGRTEQANHHTDSSGQSLDIHRVRTRTESNRRPKSGPNPLLSSPPIERAQKLLAKLPHLTDADVAKIARVELAEAKAARTHIDRARSC